MQQGVVKYREHRENKNRRKKEGKRRKIITTNVFSIRHIIFHASSSQQRDSLTLFCEKKKEKEPARNLKEVHVYIFSFAKERLLFVIKNTSKS